MRQKFFLFIVVFLVIFSGCNTQEEKNPVTLQINRSIPSFYQNENWNKNFFKVKDTSNPSKTPIKDFIEEYLEKSHSERIGPFTVNAESYAVEAEVNKKDAFLNVIISFPADQNILTNPLWYLAESHCSLQNLPRAEYNLLQKLEQELQQKFGIEKMTLSYRDFESGKLTEVYRDHKYLYDSIILGLSPGGDFAELSFEYNGVNSGFGYTYDMLKGTRVSSETYDVDDTTYYCIPDSSGCRAPDEEEISFCKNITLNDRVKENIKPLSDPEKSFLQDKVMITKDIEIVAENDPQALMEGNNGPIPDTSTIITIKYRHLPSQKELVIKNITLDSCDIDPVGFYGHERMKGIIFFYVDKNCHWINTNAEILGQELLDEKLQELENLTRS